MHTVRGDAFEMMIQHSGGGLLKPTHTQTQSVLSTANAGVLLLTLPPVATHPTTLQSSASEFPQVESCALLPSLSFGGLTKSNCLGGGRVRMKLTCAEAVQQKCIHQKVCMSV